jgi:hypothetical protein
MRGISESSRGLESEAPPLTRPRQPLLRKSLSARYGNCAGRAGALLPSQFGSAPELDMLNPGHRQVVEATLICLEAISRTKPHSVVAMEYEAK